ncbi:MAG: ABC transporter ATP-binding protein [Rhodobacteraceae bacterium]|nr:ABC transporter ATP-binding protein [Paracoccaceae bacterium]
MFDTYRKLLDLLTPREKGRFYILLVLILFMGFFEMVGVASIVPFMVVLSDPGIIQRHSILQSVYNGLGFTDPNNFMIFLGFGVFAIVVIGTAFRTVVQYAVFRFSTMRSDSISSRMLEGYLFQPYTWFLNRHSGDLSANILGDVGQVVNRSLRPAMSLLTYAVVVLALVGLLIFVRPEAAFASAVLLGGSYLLIYVSVQKYLHRLGQERKIANDLRFQIVGEAIGGIKDVKLLGLEKRFLQRFHKPSRRLAEAEAMSSIIGEVPRYILEAVAFGGMLAFVLFLLIRGDGSLASVIPVLAIYAFAGVRIFPALQKIYNSVTLIRFSKPTLDKLHEDMIEAQANMRQRPELDKTASVPLNSTLELVDIHYAYPKAERTALQGLSLEIPARSTIGIVGGTGAGKTTAVDIVLGLLIPDQGKLLVDGLEITETNRHAWQRSIGYVPQQIFLTDASIASNIAFGRRPDEIDMEAVEHASRIAELHKFVMDEMPQGYETKVGERGVRLSGGQRQRIGIARALYHDPDVLILDEATSALDNLTERAVMDAVHNLGHAKTIIMIAHRLTTVRDCDTIFMLEQGRVVAAGSYTELFENNRQFRTLAGGA